jgi:hypothetical protein
MGLLISMLTKVLPVCGSHPEEIEVHAEVENSMSCECCSTRNVTDPDEDHEEKHNCK